MQKKLRNMMLVIIIIPVVAIFFAQMVFGIYSLFRASSLLENTHTGAYTLGDRDKEVFTILVDGDSIAAGVGASSFKSSLAGLIAGHYSRGYLVKVNNIAKSGSKMRDLSEKDVGGDYDLAIVVISSNDVFRFTDIDEYRKSTQVVVDKYARIAKKAVFVGPGRLYDANSIPTPLRLFYRYTSTEYSNILRKETEKYENTYHASPITSKIQPKSYGHTLAEDNFHPNDNGIRYWFDITKIYLDK